MNLAHLPRQQRRAAIRAELKTEQRSPKHSIAAPVEGEYDGIHPEAATEVLCDPKGRITNAYRKECHRARAKVFTPAAKQKEGFGERKIAEKNFRQLRNSFRRSYRKRFDHIPTAIKRLDASRVFVNRRRVFGQTADAIVERKAKLLHTLAAMHDRNIALISNEIRRRHAKAYEEEAI